MFKMVKKNIPSHGFSPLSVSLGVPLQSLHSLLPLQLPAGVGVAHPPEKVLVHRHDGLLHGLGQRASSFLGVNVVRHVLDDVHNVGLDVLVNIQLISLGE